MALTRDEYRDLTRKFLTNSIESDSLNEQSDPFEAEQRQLHMSGRNQNVMDDLHTAIDALINTMGHDEALAELRGIVDEWDREMDNH